VNGGAGIFVSHEVKLIEAKKVNAHAAFVEMRSTAVSRMMVSAQSSSNFTPQRPPCAAPGRRQTRGRL
jgi:hypothetical protein